MRYAIEYLDGNANWTRAAWQGSPIVFHFRTNAERSAATLRRELRTRVRIITVAA